ncbi:putative PLP-dependent enzyme possibly involved in cell wall biogenesis [Desulfitobacterium dehalogenans ATCC 51507]|uniref:Putative PLP-dependent enzyme possibly involved in cell wall biogenesis n=1 Tax=Desulfitobacterium dehalogenans (strain ATCC 51507 / DSM 9161 / JW/IU-DC1) TaxID=756499 RepID=I4ADT7_DESDJ|nr:DegT/DnrJ/EryC1/StrS family aminotransferase [Desulfitobacterium dehalogenans]AFM02122.1 putative PLP-dependent enzyme possibly involved in cell wall biogenesis [Desulfitobacterium dehalogenans ATCC 51507]
MSIPLLDLKAQYLSIKEEMDQAVLAVLDSSKFIFGPEMKTFEEEMAAYCGTKHAVAVGNGTDALVIALKACGIGPGDEVITSPFTFFASAESIALVGATPVFVDVEPHTLNMDAAKLEEKITPRTKGIIPVHVFGQMADMDLILALAQKYDLKVIEDAAQAIGAEYQGRKAGSLGDAGTFSFFPTKNLGGYGDGGMIVTNDDALAEEVRMLRFHGCKTKYYHDQIGYNSRLDELQAAILRVKFRYIDQWNNARAEKAALYHQLLAPLADAHRIILPHTDAEKKHVFHLYVLRTAQREKLMAALKSKGVANAIYYPVPLHLQNALAYLGYQAGDFPIAEEACQQALAIPCYPELTSGQQEEIAAILFEVLG